MKKLLLALCIICLAVIAAITVGYYYKMEWLVYLSIAFATAIQLFSTYKLALYSPIVPIFIHYDDAHALGIYKKLHNTVDIQKFNKVLSVLRNYHAKLKSTNDPSYVNLTYVQLNKILDAYLTGVIQDEATSIVVNCIAFYTRCEETELIIEQYNLHAAKFLNSSDSINRYINPVINWIDSRGMNKLDFVKHTIKYLIMYASTVRNQNAKLSDKVHSYDEKEYLIADSQYTYVKNNPGSSDEYQFMSYIVYKIIDYGKENLLLNAPSTSNSDLYRVLNSKFPFLTPLTQSTYNQMLLDYAQIESKPDPINDMYIANAYLHARQSEIDTIDVNYLALKRKSTNYTITEAEKVNLSNVSKQNDLIIGFASAMNKADFSIINFGLNMDTNSIIVDLDVTDDIME